MNGESNQGGGDGNEEGRALPGASFNRLPTPAARTSFMLGSALQHPVETDGGDAGVEEQDSYWPSSPHPEWQGGGQTCVETGDDDEYRPTVAEVEAAAAEDSAAGAGGDADVEEEVQEQEGEGAGRNARELHGGDNGRGGRGRGGRGGGRVGRGQGRSSARAQAVGNAGGHSGGHASGPPVDGRGGGRVGRVAHSAARAGRGGSGGGRAAEAAPDPGPGNAPTQRSDGVGSTPLRAGGISRGGGTAGSRGRASKRQRREDLPKDSVVEGLAGKHYPGLLVGMFGELEDGCRPCRVCGDVMGWDGGSTGTGWKHVKRAHYPNVQIWVRRFLDPAKPKDLEFPWGGYGVSGDGPPVPNPHGGAWEHAAAWPNIPAAAAAAGSGAGGGGSGSRSGVGMHAFMSPRVSLDELRSALVELFADADLPFRLVDRASFRRFVALLNPSAKDLLGSRYRLARDMQAFSEVAREELRQEIVGDGLAGRVSLSTDIWTSENHTAFMCVTVHWITSEFRLRSGILDFVQLEGSHTGSLIAETLERILTEAGLQDVVFAVTTDNAENNNKAMRLLSGDPAEGPGAWTANPLLDIGRHVRCLAHVMNIAVQEALKLDDVKEALKRIRDACSYIGWLREKLDKIRLSDVHWDALVELKNFLQPFHSITKVAEASLYPTAAAVVPLYNQLLDKMEITYREPAVSPLTQALITKALGKLKKYPYGTKEELAIATFLDPRYKTIFFQMPQWEALNAAQVTEVGGCARSVQGVDEPTVMRLVRDRLVAYQERVRSRGGGGEVTSGMGEVTDGAGVSVQAAGTALMAIKSWMAQNTSGRSLNVAGAARSLVELCYEAEDDGF
ncbi:unnamed protein product [Closterium sp. NIES-65]|nr:unnamed protein product [Closterium sp. NIES-65]